MPPITSPEVQPTVLLPGLEVAARGRDEGGGEVGG